MIVEKKIRAFQVLPLLAFAMLVSACGKPNAGSGVLSANSNDPFASFGRANKSNLQISGTPPAEQDLPVTPDSAHDSAPTVTAEPRSAFTAFWDKLGDKSAQWTTFTADALETYGSNVLASNPSDILSFCANYPNLSYRGREDFWIKMISAMASAESDFNSSQSFREKIVVDPKTKRMDISRGLMQLSFEDGQRYGCAFTKLEDTFDPKLNLECSVKIIAARLTKEDVISLEIPKNVWHGLSTYWGTLRPYEHQFAQIQKQVGATPICQPAASAQ